MPKTSAELLMERETSVSYGPLPDQIGTDPLAELSWHITGDAFLLRGHGDHYFFYRRGDGVTIARGPDADASEEPLWLNGSVYAAIASINGLLPIHASAVAVGGAVYAFTGPAGSGKSTLVAALGAKGLPMFCDDTLILDPSESGPIICLPGHKRLKLKPDAIEITGAAPAEKVSPHVDKFYCAPPAGEVGRALPLAELLFLEDGDETAITPISGYERFLRMQDDHYTADLYAGARDFDSAEHFRHISRLANRVAMAEFRRPRDASRFNESLSAITEYLLESRPG